MSPKRPPSRRRATPTPKPALSLPVFIAYGDVPAARDAIERVTQLLRRRACDVTLQPMLWRFDQLGQPRWRAMALHDAAHAHTIVLAMGNAPALDAGTDEWLTALTERQGGAPIHCIALMGQAEAWTISLQRSESRAAAAMSLPAVNATRLKRAPAAQAA